jgi:hypothetical protein
MTEGGTGYGLLSSNPRGHGEEVHVLAQLGSFTSSPE